MIYKCRNEKCSWKGENPTTHLMHDKDFGHVYIYTCPKCKKQIILTDEEEELLEKEIITNEHIETLKETIDDLKMALVTISLSDDIELANNIALKMLSEFNDSDEFIKETTLQQEKKIFY